VGSGVLARLGADDDERRRQREAAEQRAWRQEQSRVRRLEAPLEEFDTLCTLVMRAALQVAGYHQHDRGEWRKRRG
jgi:hypothetical protein